MRVFARQTPRHSLLLSAAGTMPAGAGRLQISGQGLPGKRKGGIPTPFACPPSSGDRAACWRIVWARLLRCNCGEASK